jgi:hypothetical protein
MERLIHRNGSLHFLLCVQNRSHPTSLEIRKVYRALPDPDGERHGLVRVIDESGEDYLYPRRYFVDIDVPKPAHKCFARAQASAQ